MCYLNYIEPLVIAPLLSFSSFVSICPLTILLLLLTQHFLRVYVNYMVLSLQNILTILSLLVILMFIFHVLGPIVLIYPCSCCRTTLLIKCLTSTLPTIMMFIHVVPFLITFLLYLTRVSLITGLEYGME